MRNDGKRKGPLKAVRVDIERLVNGVTTMHDVMSFIDSSEGEIVAVYVDYKKFVPAGNFSESPEVLD